MDPLLDTFNTAAVAIVGIVFRLLLGVAIISLLILMLVPFVVVGEAVRRVWVRAAGFEEVAGLTWRSGTYYTPIHTWIRGGGRLVRVGFDEIAARVLRHLDGVILPLEGATLKAGDALLTLISGSRRIQVPAPVDGVVRRVNRRLHERPDAVIRDPYRRGWLLELAPADERYTALPSNSKARGWFEQEAVRLSSALEHATGVVAADGGDLAVPPHMAMTDEQLDDLARDFLAARAAPSPKAA